MLACKQVGLPEPTFEQRAGQFVVIIWRSWLTTAMLVGMDLNDRQRIALVHVQTHRRITNTEFRELTGAITRTAARDLDDMVRKGILDKIGRTGRKAHYVLAEKQDRNRTNRTPGTSDKKQDRNRTNKTSPVSSLTKTRKGQKARRRVPRKGAPQK